MATAGLLAGGAGAIAATLLSLRRDAEVSFMVTLGATLLLTPLLWQHYLVSLLLPAAFLAQRGRPWALCLPLLAWLPLEFLPLLAIAATLLPFLARPVRGRLSGGGGPGSGAQRLEADRASGLNPGTLQGAGRQLDHAGGALDGHHDPVHGRSAAGTATTVRSPDCVGRGHEERRRWESA